MHSLIVLLFISIWAPVAYGADVAGQTPANLPPWRAMDYGPYLSATFEVAPGNIANKGIAIRLDPGPGGVSRGREFMLFDTDTLRWGAGWIGNEFIDWRNIAFTGEHEAHVSIVGTGLFSNPDSPGWAWPDARFEDQRLVGRDGNRYGPMPRDWGRWRGLFVHGNRVILSYSVGGCNVLESPSAEGIASTRVLSRTLHVGPRPVDLILQVANQSGAETELKPAAIGTAAMNEFVIFSSADHRVPAKSNSGNLALQRTVIAGIGDTQSLKWIATGDGNLRLLLRAGTATLRLKLLYGAIGAEAGAEVFVNIARKSEPPIDLTTLTSGGQARWKQQFVTEPEIIGGDSGPYVLDQISLPNENTYRSWMRLGGFDFFADGRRAAVCTWQGDVWAVEGVGEKFGPFSWKRIAAGMFQPLGLRIVADQIFVTCRDQITVLRDLNGDGETDFYENFNNDAQVTEHFHEFAMDLQTDREGNFYYAKAARHAKQWLVPQHGNLLKVTKDGSQTQVMARGFRAPNGVCVNGDGTLITSDQEGHWIPANRIDWVEPISFHGNMLGYHEPGRSSEDFVRPLVWIHKSLDRSPAEQLWVTSDRWGPLKGSLISLSYGTGKILSILHEQIGSVRQGGVFQLPIAEAPTGIMRGRFHPGDGQLYAAGLFSWAGNKTKPGGFYRVRYTGLQVTVPNALHATQRGILIRFTGPLDMASASDVQNYSVSRWEYKRSATYGSQDYKISKKGEPGRDLVEVTGILLSPDHKSVLVLIPDMQPCMQMEIKFSIRSADGTELEQTIQNTIHVVGNESL